MCTTYKHHITCSCLCNCTQDICLAAHANHRHKRAYIATCGQPLTGGPVPIAGTYSNLVKQAKSKQKILDKMEDAGLTPPVQHESTFHFKFPDCDKLPPPVLPFQDVSFAYSGKDKDCLYRVCNLSIFRVHTVLWFAAHAICILCFDLQCLTVNACLW